MFVNDIGILKTLKHELRENFMLNFQVLASLLKSNFFYEFLVTYITI